MDAFRYTAHAQDVIFARGAAARLGEAVERAGWRRLLLCTTRGMVARGRAAALADVLGERLAARFDAVEPHVPQTRVDQATALAAEREVDAVLALGGGSAIGTAKAVSLALDERRGGRPAGTSVATAPPLVPVVAIPTTYAGSEMTPVYGVTRQVDGAPRKVTVSDPRAAPRLVVYDPLLTLDLPPRVTAGTAINAAAHCVEALYSVAANPLSSAAAMAGLRTIALALPRCYAAGDDLAARTQLLTGAFLAGTALAGVAMGLHHGICHVLGGTAGVAHGDANGVILPHALRFTLPATPQLALAAEALGVVGAGQDARAAAEAAVAAVEELIARVELPRRLREIGVREGQVPELARLAFASQTVQANPRPPRDAGEIEALLRAAW